MANAIKADAPTRIRYVVLLLTVTAYMVAYLDRVLISVAGPSIQKEFGFSIGTMGLVLGAYQVSYALFQIPGGWLGDRFGPRRALSGVVVCWSAFIALAAFAWSFVTIYACLFLFGVSLSGAFPIATRSLSRWMLPSERGFAQGATHAGSRLGGALTPFLVVFFIAQYGWRMPFLLFALIGLLWAALWFWFYRDTPAEHRLVNEGERETLATALGPGAGRSRNIPWRAILTSPRMWLLACMYFCYCTNLVFFITWFPKYLSAARSFSLEEMGLYSSLPLAAGLVGDLCGGSLSDFLVKRTGNITFSRRIVAVAGFLMTGALFPIAVLVSDPITSVFCFSFAVFTVELTVANSWAVTLDIGGEYAGSVSAVMNCFGNFGGAIYTMSVGYIVAAAGWDTAILILSGFAFLGAILFSRIDASKPLHVPALG